MDLLEICPEKWTSDNTDNAQQIKSRLQKFNHDGNWKKPMTVKLSTGNEDEKSMITTSTTGASKPSLLLVVIPTIAVAILVFVGAFIFIKSRTPQETKIVL